MDREPTPSFVETVAETALAANAAAASAASGISQLTSSSAADEGRFLPGALLGGRYRILGLLGRGGMGEVYRAMDLALGQAVALKFLPEEASRNPRLLERFHGEVRVARLVSHPNVCRVFDIGEVEGTPFISMEYVDGEDLATLLTRIGRLPGDKALQAARQLCAGLAAAHDRGVIHRDLKPQNIMMNKRGDVLIMDFGLAAIADQLSGTEVRNGTPAYMAPEQLRGAAVTPASDIYALGLVLYELFTGKRPYEAKTLQHLIDLQESGHLASMTSIASDVDPAVEKVIRRCLDADPVRRPPGPLTVAAALPGGDPLAAALAAGETPSPELVANAGKVEGLALRYSVPCLAAIVASVVVAIVYFAGHRAQLLDPASNPPDVLAHSARAIAAAFGYAQRPADTAVWIENRGEVVDYLAKLPGPPRWSAWLSVESPTVGIYRESPDPMIASPDGNLDRDNPPMTSPGMIEMTLDGHGRLLSFHAVPRSTAASATPNDVFRAANLDLTKFEEIPPAFTPRHASDLVKAWRGPHPDVPGMTLTVQMASWRGQITDATLVYPWNASAAPPSQAPLLSRVRRWLLLAIPIFGSLFAALVARRNWKQGRTDRQGAFRIAAAKLVLAMIAWVGIVHPVPTDDMLSLWWYAAADALLMSAILWTVYLAIEPAIRARYPHALITWNRLLAGRWLDPQVCSHVLIGAAAGCGLWVGVTFLEPNSFDAVHSGGNAFVLWGTRQWFARYALNSNTAMTYGLLVFATICFVRRLVRYDLIAAVVTAALFAMNESAVARAEKWQFVAILFIVIYSVLAFVLIRFGLIASMAAIFYANGFSGFWLGSDWKAWYVPSGLASVLLLLGIAGVAFWKSLGDRDLLGEGT